MSAANTYSSRWFEVFHFGISEDRTATETEFICAMAPLPEFRTVLDVCCGAGRHSRALSHLGYVVTGIERDDGAIAKAREVSGGPTYIHADVRDDWPVNEAFDLAIVMSQSFGYFNEAMNRELLRRLCEGVRPGGRIILDLWNPEFFINHEGERKLEMPAGIVREEKKVRDGWLLVHLVYPDGAAEDFEWELFWADDLEGLAQSMGLRVVNLCTGFASATRPNANDPRMQVVLERI